MDYGGDTGRPLKTRRRWRRRAAIVAGAIVVLLGLAGGGVAVTVWLTLPPGHEKLHLPGLSAPVDVTFDSHGIPRIRAANAVDAAGALGFLHARDRMFQMELMRRAASGRLSEIAGSAALPLDRMARTLGERLHAERSYAALPADTKALLQSYTAGVNAWIALRGRLSGLEFVALGRPEPWTPVDCLLWNETVSLWLSDNFRTELARASLAGKLPMERILQLWPGQTLLPQAQVQPVRQGLLDALPDFPAPFTLPSEASNAWAVDGAHSATGHPLLAGDPHLRLGVPSLWYLARIETPDNTLVGATAPGVPFMVLGHNRHIAWSFTASGIDTQDVFVETELPGGFYKTPDGKLPFVVRDERIVVSGGPDEILHVRTTRHGPVVSDLDRKDATSPVLAVEMANLDLGSAVPGIMALNTAGSVAEAGRAAPLIAAPVQNLTVADGSTIGIFTTGSVPVRRSGDGTAPVPGADGAHDWTGFASGDALPHVVSPAGGVVANANDRTAPPDFPVYLGRDWPAPFRARRIHELLDGRRGLTLDDFAAMQADPVSVFAADVLPVLRALPAGQGDSATAQAMLTRWNGTMEAGGPEPLIFNATMQLFVHRVLEASHVPENDAGPWSGFAAWLLTPDGGSWCGGDCRPILASALRDSVETLKARFGANIAAWRWDAAHKAIFAHPLLGGLPVVGPLATRRIGIAGDDSTLFRGGSGVLGDYTASHGAAYRAEYDLGNLENSRFIAVPGQSGNIFSVHAWDMLANWAKGVTIPIAANPDEVADTVRLEP